MHILLILSAFIIIFVVITLSRFFINGRAFKPFYFSNDKLITNTFIRKKHEIINIDHIILRYQSSYGQDVFATFQIIKNDGRRSKKYKFNQSALDGKIVFVHSEEKLFEAIDFLEQELRENNIPVKVIK